MLTRRQFLRATAAGAALVSLARAAGARGRAADPALLAVVGPDVVRAIGRGYRALVPSEDDAGALRAALRDARRAGDRRPVDDDFAAGRTVVVDGWVLSTTEARQCALFSLLAA